MEKKEKAIESLRNALNEDKKNEKRITLKEMIYNDDYGTQDEDAPGYENVPEFNGEEGLENGTSGEKPIDRNKPIPGETEQDPEIMKMLSDIRLAVINGLAKLANKPDSMLYDCLKKVLGIIDKPIEAGNREK